METAASTKRRKTPSARIVASIIALCCISVASPASAADTIAPSTPLRFLTPSALPDATLGQPYLGYIVADYGPGSQTFRFRIVSGKVPAGTQYVTNTLPVRLETRIIGTPTKAGTSTFTVEVTDNTGAVARRTFTLKVV